MAKDFMEEEIMHEDEIGNEKASRKAQEKKEEIKKIQSILDHISEKTGATFQLKFAEMLYRLINKETFTLHIKHANAIIAEWEIWKEYVDEESVSEYIAHKLEVFCRIHCGVTYGHEYGEATSKSYIGNYAKLIKEPPANMYAIIHSNGSVSLNGRSYPVPANDALSRAEKIANTKRSNTYYNPFARDF